MKVELKALRLGFVFLLLICASSLFSQEKVSNVVVSQENSNIIITYKLSEKADIRAYVSVDGGKNYTVIKKATGDVGVGVKPGIKKIVWNVLEEYEDFVHKKVCFKVAEVLPRNTQSSYSSSYSYGDRYNSSTNSYNSSRNSYSSYSNNYSSSYSSSSSYRERMYEPYMEEQGTFEMSWFGLGASVGSSFAASVSTLELRFWCVQVCLADFVLGYSLLNDESYLAYQPAVHFFVPVKYNGAVYFGAGPNIYYGLDTETSIWFKTEFGYRYHWGSTASSDFFFKYDGDVSVGLTVQW